MNIEVAKENLNSVINLINQLKHDLDGACQRVCDIENQIKEYQKNADDYHKYIKFWESEKG